MDAVPVDGVLLDGGVFDESALTGRPHPPCVPVGTPCAAVW
ncbi:hypothetical protein ACFFSW_00445 [Saccharothrix longispora]|uniref:Cation transport ATPase n=1 Tax=Saccharothrix longispora TaxID=33920 RepID=A0ABU1PUX7_9PSEU|nr:hypothetical protein [Saccharothrix longispora]MDR6594452.1 cation transport ATPase [Saccharothrix longispora]